MMSLNIDMFLFVSHFSGALLWSDILYISGKDVSKNEPLKFIIDISRMTVFETKDLVGLLR